MPDTQQVFHNAVIISTIIIKNYREMLRPQQCILQRSQVLRHKNKQI